MLGYNIFQQYFPSLHLPEYSFFLSDFHKSLLIRITAYDFLHTFRKTGYYSVYHITVKTHITHYQY